MIVAVTGTPGTGKTEISKRLARILGFEYIDLNLLAEKERLHCGYDRKRKCPIVDLGALAARIKAGFEGRSVVLDSHYSHEMPCDIVVLLRCRAEILRKRLERKGFSSEKVQENIDAEITEVIKSECLGKNVIEFDTSEKSAAEAAIWLAKRISKLPEH